MADPSAIELMDPQADAHIVYSFHLYDPYSFYRTDTSGGALQYPGLIPADSGPVLWNLDQHVRRLKPVTNWQTKHSIKTSQKYLRKCGVWKDAIGADRCIMDETEVFGTSGWPWIYYAFREDRFPHAILELSGALTERSETPLFDILKALFR